MDDIRYLRHNEINKEKWNECVINSPNGLIYANSWYMDAMSPNWQALVYKDYEVVMPLTCSRKMGVSYLSQPAFSQQLGVIGFNEIPKELIKGFVDIACRKFPLVEINLNFKNNFSDENQRSNLILDLNQPFEKLKEKFRKDLIKKPVKAGLIIESSNDYQFVINAFIKYYSDRLHHLKKKNFDRFSKICAYLSNSSRLLVRKAITKEGKFVAGAIFFRDEKRIYYIMSASNAEGRKFEANALLLHEVIREFAESKCIFDFEGSSIPSIRFFFKKFAPDEEFYPIIRINNLPSFIKKVKTITG